MSVPLRFVEYYYNKAVGLLAKMQTSDNRMPDLLCTMIEAKRSSIADKTLEACIMYRSAIRRMETEKVDRTEMDVLLALHELRLYEQNCRK